MAVQAHEVQDAAELVKIDVLLRLQGVVAEKVAHPLKCFQLANPQAEPVVVITANDARFEETFERFEDLAVSLMLDHHELRKHLVTGRHLVVAVQADMKAALSVDESDNPIHA